MKSYCVTEKINIPLYGGWLNIHVTKDLSKTLSDVNFEGDLECDACCVYNLDGGASYDLVFRHGRIQHGIIAHECFHLTHRIMQGIRKAYEVNNDEPEAYLIQFLVDSVYAFLKKNKIKVS